MSLKKYQVAAAAQNQKGAFAQVLSFLFQELKVETYPPGTRLPTAKELAAQLSVSEGTVKNVYRQLAGEKKIRSVSGSGSFWTGTPPVAERLRIGIDLFASPTSTRWGHRIYGGLLNAQFRSSTPFHLEEIRPGSEFDGIVVFTQLALQTPELRALMHRLPYVSLNPLREGVFENFIAPDFFEVSRQLGKAWLKAGRRRILCVLKPGLDESFSVRQRYSGLLCGLEIGASPVEIRLLESPSASQEDGRRVMETFLQSEKWRPDAVYCAGDQIAFGVLEALEAAGFSIPQEVSIVGGHGSEPSGSGYILTSTEHALEKIGEEMIALLLERITKGGARLPGKTLPTPIVPGTTTTREENRLFAALLAQAPS